MMNLIKKYIRLTFEQKTLLHTMCGLCFSALLAGGKFIIGLLTDYSLCVVAAYTAALLLAKFECVLAVKSDKRSLQTRNALVSAFLFLSSVVYIGFMCRLFFVESTAKQHHLLFVALLAFISFAEFGFALSGLVKTKNKGHFYRNIKIINFAIALIAILTTQMTILDYMATSANKMNALSGMGVGIFLALCALYVLLAPKISVAGRERQTFTAKEIAVENGRKYEITLCKSFVYGSYVYRATVHENTLEGDIERDPSLWKRMHVIFKIICCILSEILIFLWLFGRVLFFLRSINLPKRLERKLLPLGFIKIPETTLL